MTSLINRRQTLRQQLRQSRNALSEAEQQNAAGQLLTLSLNHLKEISSIKNVALYLSNDGEISPHCLCEYFWENKINTYLPIVEGKQLTFGHYSSSTIWQENRFGIKEPNNGQIISSDELDLVLLPLVGFDKKGGRLGMGGGFYDRTFENKESDVRPLLIGLAHDCQQVDSLPLESWDVPLQMIMTPTTIIKIAKD